MTNLQIRALLEELSRNATCMEHWNGHINGHFNHA